MWGWIKQAASTVVQGTTKAVGVVSKETTKIAVEGVELAEKQVIGAANNVKDGAEKMGTSAVKGDIKGVAEGAIQVKKGVDMVDPKAVATEIAVNEIKKQINK